MSASILDPRMIDPSKPLQISQTNINSLTASSISTPFGTAADWGTASTIVQANSALWEESADISNIVTFIQSNSANWEESADITVMASNSANWNTAYQNASANLVYSNVSAVSATPNPAVSAVTNIVVLTQAAYDSISIPSPTTLYYIISA